MLRILFWIVLIMAAVWLIRRALRAPGAVHGKPSVEGDLVSCARCGVHLPRGEARNAGGLPFCCDEHARLGREGE
jgi:uncharacterized protein